LLKFWVKPGIPRLPMIKVRGALILKRCLSRRSLENCTLSAINCLSNAKAKPIAHIAELRFHGDMQVLCIAGLRLRLLS